MKTLVLTDKEYSFDEALRALLEGKCLGIKPKGNTSYVELFKPHWFNPESPDFMLRWHPRCKADENSTDTEIRSDQFLGPWYLVIANHRDLMREDQFCKFVRQE